MPRKRMGPPQIATFKMMKSTSVSPLSTTALHSGQHIEVLRLFRTGMLFGSLMNWCSCGATVRTTLPLMQKIRERLPGVKKIWENASLFKESARHFKRALDFEEDVRKALENGTVNMDSRVMPDDLKVRLPAGATSPTPV